MPNQTKGEPEPVSARQRAYARVIEAARRGLEHYYYQYPDRADDPRAKDALEWSLRGITRILTILDDYDISDPPPATAAGGHTEGAPRA